MHLGKADAILLVNDAALTCRCQGSLYLRKKLLVLEGTCWCFQFDCRAGRYHVAMTPSVNDTPACWPVYRRSFPPHLHFDAYQMPY
jgi:hypothetical protein